jgi:hypothetical protein
MSLTAVGQLALLLSLAKAGGPVTLAVLKARHPGLAGEDVGRGVVRLAVAGLAEMRRVGGTLQVALAPAAACVLSENSPRLDCRGHGRRRT